MQGSIAHNQVNLIRPIIIVWDDILTSCHAGDSKKKSSGIMHFQLYKNKIKEPNKWEPCIQSKISWTHFCIIIYHWSLEVLHDDSPNASQAAANTCQPQLNKHMMHIHNYDDGLASIIENFREFIISLFFSRKVKNYQFSWQYTKWTEKFAFIRNSRLSKMTTDHTTEYRKKTRDSSHRL